MGQAAVRMTLVMLVLTGLLYPLAAVGIGQVLFPGPADGSLLYVDGRPAGSALIGQAVRSPALFWPRPSGTVDAAGRPDPYDGTASGGPNLGPTNRALIRAVAAAVSRYTRAPDAPARLPQNLVTASASGLDPDITPAGALAQVPRVSRLTGIPRTVLDRLVARYTRGRTLGLFGHPRVNVLELNLAVLAWLGRHRAGGPAR